MPARNTIREFAADNYYHVYNRGVEKRQIFLDDQDYVAWLGILKKYITGKQNPVSNRHKIDKLDNKVNVLAYCLMPNHFHLLLYQITPNGITELMRRLSISYAMYFNERYGRVGSLFQGKYKASLINSDSYLHHISRYIHMNPENYLEWPYSSMQNYIGNKKSEWLNTKPVMDLFDGDKSRYLDFVKDYHDSKEELSVLKWQLANDIDL